MAWAPDEEGALGLVQFRVEGPEVLHERLVLAAGSLAQGRGILTLDFDPYEEAIRGGSTNVQRVRPLGSPDDIPDRVDGSHLYGFRGLRPQSTQNAWAFEMTARARVAPLTLALVVRMSRSLLTPPVCAPQGAPLPPAVLGMLPTVAASILDALQSKYWNAAEQRGSYGKGDFIGPTRSSGSTVVGNRVILKVGETWVTAGCMTQSELRAWMDDDPRTLPGLFDAHGDRKRSFASVVEHMEFHPEWHLVTAWTRWNCHSNGGSAFAPHDRWVSTRGDPSVARSIHGRKALARMLDYAVEADQLSALTSITVELILRRQFLIREARRTPSLMRHVVYLLRDEAAVAEENMKALEEMKLSKRRDEGRSKGRGKDDKAGAAAGAEGL